MSFRNPPVDSSSFTADRPLRSYGAEGFEPQSLTHLKTPSAGCIRLETLDCASQPESRKKKQKGEGPPH